MHEAQQCTTKICTQGSWWNFPNTNLYLAALFCDITVILSPMTMFHGSLKTNDVRFLAVSGRLDLSLSKPHLKSGELLFMQDSHAAFKVTKQHSKKAM